MRAEHPRAPRQRPGSSAPAQVRSSPAFASSDRRYPSRCPPAPAPYSPTRPLCRSAVETGCRARSRAAVSVTFQPTSSMLSWTSSPQVRRVQHRADAPACNVVDGQRSLRSVVVDQVHGLAVLEAEHHTSVAGEANPPLARTVALVPGRPDAGRITIKDGATGSSLAASVPCSSPCSGETCQS